MWAQIIRHRATPENHEKIVDMVREMRINDFGAGRGLVRGYILRNQRDPNEYYHVIVFQSEEAARERERLPETQEFGRRMRDLIDGQPDFVDLELIEEFSP